MPKDFCTVLHTLTLSRDPVLKHYGLFNPRNTIVLILIKWRLTQFFPPLSSIEVASDPGFFKILAINYVSIVTTFHKNSKPKVEPFA